MTVFKRGSVYWFEFWRDGQRHQKSTRQKNFQAAKDIESAFRTALAKGDVGITERPKVPTLEQFQKKFMDEIRVRRAGKPQTIEFYSFKYAALLAFAPLAKAPLDRIDESLIAQFIQAKSKTSKPATVNRCLATLRRALRLAQEWRMIQRVPRIRLLPGERQREFVLSREAQRVYLAACPEPLRSVAELSLETGTRIGEVLTLRWSDVHLDPLGNAARGYIHIRSGKSRNARRNVSLTIVARCLLEARKARKSSEWVFPCPDGKNASIPLHTRPSAFRRAC